MRKKAKQLHPFLNIRGQDAQS